MGLMNFVNLAHGAFAMFGGYLSVWLMSRWGVPFLATLPLCFLTLGLAGAACERLLYRRLYGQSQLRQVLFSIGLTFMAVAVATYYWGPTEQHVELPSELRGQVSVLGLHVGAYRLFLVALVIVVSLGLGYVLRSAAASQVSAER
jgi:branched-chain amino acid transport system permease protein